MLENIHEYMGQRATFTYFERTKAGSYRHPLFKCIRNYDDCAGYENIKNKTS